MAQTCTLSVEHAATVGNGSADWYCSCLLVGAAAESEQGKIPEAQSMTDDIWMPTLDKFLHDSLPSIRRERRHRHQAGAVPLFRRSGDIYDISLAQWRVANVGNIGLPDGWSIMILRSRPSLLAALACFSAAVSASAAEPSPPLGQIVGQKTFLEASQNYNFPATNGFLWRQTNYPPNPVFNKLYDDSALWCFGMFDVVPSTTDVVGMGIVIDDWKQEVLQALGAPAATMSAPGINKGEVELITFSFGYVFGRIPAGSHDITIWMVTKFGAPAVFNSTEANLQCLEMVLPGGQR
jgi:hypothetical protein